jgi:hypothetical protein
LTDPVWRNIRLSPEFDRRLEHYFGSSDEAGSFIAALLHREIIPYVLQAFKEEWDSLPAVTPHQAESRERYYHYVSESARAELIVFGRLDRVSIFQHYIEEDITLYHLVVRAPMDGLDDPDESTPNR